MGIRLSGFEAEVSRASAYMYNQGLLFVFVVFDEERPVFEWAVALVDGHPDGQPSRGSGGELGAGFC